MAAPTTFAKTRSVVSTNIDVPRQTMRASMILTQTTLLVCRTAQSVRTYSTAATAPPPLYHQQQLPTALSQLVLRPPTLKLPFNKHLSAQPTTRSRQFRLAIGLSFGSLQ
jgi:hypothetical protein